MYRFVKCLSQDMYTIYFIKIGSYLTETQIKIIWCVFLRHDVVSLSTFHFRYIQITIIWIMLFVGLRAKFLDNRNSQFCTIRKMLFLLYPGVKLWGSHRISAPPPQLSEPPPVIWDPPPWNTDPAPFCLDPPLSSTGFWPSGGSMSVLNGWRVY